MKHAFSQKVKQLKKSSRKFTKEHPRATKFFWLGVFPVLFFLLSFFILQPNHLTQFSSQFYLDKGDGFQNVWNIWWVNESISDLGTHPYFSTMLHWPHGIPLFPQTMNIVNGIIGLGLINVLGFSLVQAVNFAVVFAFVFSGVTMFWFVKKLFGVYWVAIVAGYLFTFSSYHFAHGQGHLQLVTMQFLPLFLLAFWTLVEKVRYRYAILAALALTLVLMSDYYYFFWSVMVGGFWVLWQLWKRNIQISRQTVKVFSVFAATVLLLCGPLVYKLLSLNKHDPLTGSHDPIAFSLDPLAVFIPGGSWYWGSLTSGYTEHLSYFAESSMFFGFGLLALLVVALYLSLIKKHTTPSFIVFWWAVLLLFGILALGPHLSIAGRTLDSVPLPYVLLETLFPTLKISGMPVRWILMSLIAAIIIGSWVLSKVDLSNKKHILYVGLFVVATVFSLWPYRMPLSSTGYQSYVYELKKLPYGAVIDNGALSGAEQLYNQTLHEKPIAFGYVTRSPQSVETKDFLIFAALEQRRYGQLCSQHKIRYVTLPVSRPLVDAEKYPIIYNDKRTLIYDMKNSPAC
jgi:hypothetical protein